MNTTDEYVYVRPLGGSEDERVYTRNPNFDGRTSAQKQEDAEGFKAVVAAPFVLTWNVIHGLANPHSRPTYLRWGAILLFLTLGVPLLFGLGSLVVVTILKPHMMLSHLPELWAAIQHAL
jgi:hypothetical protein